MTPYILLIAAVFGLGALLLVCSGANDNDQNKP